MRKLIASLALCGCASQAVPPGGLPDKQAPVILTIIPDSGATGVKGDAVVFRFDEIVSERPAAVTTLGDLFVVSPQRGVPSVSWHREEIHVKPRGGWLPNTTYTVTMLPGIGDLRGNVKNTGSSTFFSTGGSIDTSTISGTVYDLLSGAPAGGAIVDARAGVDTTVSWIARADSAGGFRLAHLPPKAFKVRAYVDKNRNFGIDPDEAWDTTTVPAVTSVVADLFVVVRDSVAPRLVSAVATDSVTLTATFDRPSDSASALNTDSYSVLATDSANIPIIRAQPSPRDTGSKKPPTIRSLPVISVKLRLLSPMLPKKQYRLRATGIRGLLGQSLPTEISVSTAPPATAPVRPPPPKNLPGGAVPIPIKHD